MSHEAEIPDVGIRTPGYDAEDFPYQRPQRQVIGMPAILPDQVVAPASAVLRHGKDT